MDITVTDKDSPITKGVDPTFHLKDEIYRDAERPSHLLLPIIPDTATNPQAAN